VLDVALALLFEGEELSGLVPDVALALLLPPPALEELDDLPPPLAAFELAEEPAVF